ncbi:MAG: nitroreductase family protein, partial [Acidimicrobiales bacterium]
AWPVPYWFGDAAFATMTLLLGATDEGLGACFLGSFRGEGPLLAALGVPEGWRLFGAVLIGHPDGADRPSASLDRPGPSAAERVHHGRW